ncbi:MAG: RNA polymerase subunit sigma-70 [Planctomycetaceae bacterium]|jgi:DNA-directed RNA polymerase specialized sigma24 family protein|nr:RNA polymerase subunit sigma-70 [Planctomycetaceae bacterium]
MPDGSITQSLKLLRQGDSEAMRVIWQRYFPRLVQLARDKLALSVRRAADEEDVALSALDRFWRAAQEGQFPDLSDRDGLWRLLLRITTHRAIDLARRERRQRRGGANSEETGGRCVEKDLADLTAEGPSPAFAAQIAEQWHRLMDSLDDPSLQDLAVAKMEGFTNRELAGRFDCSERTIERRLRLIRDLWRAEESG